MKNRILLFLLGTGVVFLSGCEKQGDERLQEKSRLEGAIQTEEQIKQEQELLRTKIAAMEADLTRQHDFYEDNEGHFAGRMTQGTESFQIRISLFPNLPRYQGGRQRSLAEVEAELVALTYSAQVVQWSRENPLSSVGCRFEGLKPDFVTGEMPLISPECATSYFLVLDRTAILGTAQPSSNPRQFDVYAERTESATIPRRNGRSP